VLRRAGRPLQDAVRRALPDGIDALLDLVSGGDGFAALASLVRPGGSAVTTQYVADEAALGTGNPSHRASHWNQRMPMPANTRM
jgi:hypothetical protein